MITRPRLFEFLMQTDPLHLFTTQLVQHCTAVSATAELLLVMLLLHIIIIQQAFQIVLNSSEFPIVSCLAFY